MKKILIIIILIIISVVLINFSFFIIDSCEKTNLTITSDDNLTKGDVFTIELTNEKNIGIANKTININLIDSSNNTTIINITTDSKGKCNFTIDNNADNYTVNASFSGDKNYKPSYDLQKLTIAEKITETNNPESDPSSTSYKSSSSSSDDYGYEIVYSTDPHSDKSVLDKNGKIDQDKVDYYNQKAREKYGPIG